VLCRCADQFELVRAHKCVAFHRDGNLELGYIFRGRGLLAAQHLAQTANSHSRTATRQSDQVLDTPADLDVGWRQKADAARTDIARLLRPIHALIAQLDNLKRELELVPLCASLFQDSLYCIGILLSNQSVIVPVVKLRQS
jgi:hypothetical protein